MRVKTSSFWNAVACAGAVIGAGFASGRETIVFFTRYGEHAYWLIILAVAIMTGLCVLCMKATQLAKNSADWSRVLGQHFLAKGICVLLMMMTAGGMISAAGHMAALLWNSKQAYAVGALGTLLMAWLFGFRSMRPLSLFSTLLTAYLLVALSVGYMQPRQMMIQAALPSYSIALGAAKAVG